MPDDKKNLETDPGNADPGDPGKGNQKSTKTGGEQEPINYDGWYSVQTEEVKTLVDGNISGLKSALASERDGRKEQAALLKQLSTTLKGDPKEAVDKMIADLERKDLQLGFYEDAVKAGVKNPRTAFKIAEAEGLFDRRGNANFEALKKDYPELFLGEKEIDSKGGAGVNNQPQGEDMNQMIRKAAGRG